MSARVGDVERRLDELDALPEAARETALAVVGELLALYGDGLARIVDALADAEVERLADDELVAHLLLLHGLHPVPVGERVRAALAEVEPYLTSHGGSVELLDVSDGVARLRLEGSCSGCPSSRVTVKLAIEEAILRAAPDVDEVRADGVPAPAPARAAPSMSPAAWARAGGVELATGAVAHEVVEGRPIVFLRPNGRVYAYRPACPGCGGTLDGAVLRGGELTCADCGARYDVVRAGRGVDAPQRHLEPVPLLVDDDGAIKVALG